MGAEQKRVAVVQGKLGKIGREVPIHMSLRAKLRVILSAMEAHHRDFIVLVYYQKSDNKI